MPLKPGGRAGAALRGFTLLELAIAMSILTIGLVSAASATTKMRDLARGNRERAVAQHAVRSSAESGSTIRHGIYVLGY